MLLCKGVEYTAGEFAVRMCEVATTPRMVHCNLNTLLNCYAKDCGYFEIPTVAKFKGYLEEFQKFLDKLPKIPKAQLPP